MYEKSLEFETKLLVGLRRMVDGIHGNCGTICSLSFYDVAAAVPLIWTTKTNIMNYKPNFP